MESERGKYFILLRKNWYVLYDMVVAKNIEGAQALMLKEINEPIKIQAKIINNSNKKRKREEENKQSDSDEGSSDSNNIGEENSGEQDINNIGEEDEKWEITHHWEAKKGIQ